MCGPATQRRQDSGEAGSTV